MGPSLPLMWISYAVAGSGGGGLRCRRVCGVGVGCTHLRVQTQHFARCDAELRVDDLQELDDVSQ
eukprot:2188940-Rhodomonas_salina.1